MIFIKKLLKNKLGFHYENLQIIWYICLRSHVLKVFGFFNLGSNKRPRSPVNGGSGEAILADELRREAKKARRETGGRKAKKRRCLLNF